MKLINTFAAVVVSAAFVLSFAACSGDTVIPAPAPSANIAVVHASPNGPAVELRLDDNLLYSVAGSGLVGIPYLGSTFAATTSAGYLNIAAGKRNFKVFGTTTAATIATQVAADRKPVINADVTFDADKYYSIFASDSVSKLTPIIVEDDISLPATGKAKVRFAHMAVGAPNVDIAVKTVGNLLFTNRTFKSVSDFISVDPGTIALEVRPTGTTTVALNATVTVAANRVYTIMARGFAADTAAARRLGATVITNR